ncbi:MAG: SMC-Scp complex subunit ScpB [Planctomycetaceae bacterium]|nr:SMC-Scp complex subunit ScpB [Planctomycetaceae bacterium]MBT6155863.1 SMC-Scp complex subunit ScpB [Planctomycetaceae bacterium]MBT6484249.1 SMC-Scp complex subunit ScpB [Planctomycetaceae bacterium]MBT6493198.1 SMC-Scp complex subunit ScpB [Planctomycetaceae bacterium]
MSWDCAPRRGWQSCRRESALEFRNWLRRRRTSAGSIEDTSDGAHPTFRSPKMARLEAVLLIADGALSKRRLAQLATLVDAAEVTQLIDALNAAYDADESAFRIERVATGFQLLTRPQFARWLDKLHHRQSQLKLSPPALETLTIVAYRQPVTRADVEEVRGVQCAEMLKQLMDRNLVRITGHDESLGRPYLYGTTRAFLESFGLRDLKDLPMSDRLRRKEPPSADADDVTDEPDSDATTEADDDEEDVAAA